MLERFRSIFARSEKAAPYGMQNGIIRGSTIGELPRLGTRQLLEGYNAFPWLRAVVDKVAEIAGSVDWNAAIKKAGSKELTYLDDHPIIQLLNGGNTMFSGLALRQLAIKHLLMVGEFFWLIERNQYRMPVGLWPIPPSWVIYAPTFANDPTAIFKLQFRQWQAIVPATEMVHIYEPNPAMPYGRGSGKAAALGDELETDEYAAKHLKSFFFNSARPDFLISSADSANPFGKDQAERMEEKWAQKLQGWWKHYRPYFVSGGAIKIDKISADLKDLDVSAIRKLSRDVIIQTYGIPPETLGILENSNRATIDAAEFFMTKHVCLPKLNLVRAALQHRLVPEFDARILLGFDNPVQIDKETRLTLMETQPSGFSLDDFRMAADMPPLPNGAGKVHAVPLNYQLIDIASGELPADPNEPQEPDVIDPADSDSDKSVKFSGRKTLPAVGDRTRQFPSKSDLRLIAGKQLSDKESEKTKLLISMLSSHPSLLLGSAWSDVQGQIGQMVQSFGDAEFVALGFLEDEKYTLDANAADYIKRWTERRGLQIDVTTGAQLASLIRDGIANGKSIDELKSDVAGYFTELNGRVNAISSTEVGLALSVAQVSAFKQLNIKGKEWLSERDERVRDSHKLLDGTKVPVNSHFVASSGARGPGPRQMGDPEEDINCRCFLIPATVHEMTLAAKDQRWKTLDNELKVQEQIMEKLLKQVITRQSQLVIAAFRS